MSWASSTATRNVMRANKSKNTGPEVMLRRALSSHGVSITKYPNLPGKPDIVFVPSRGRAVAVFVDGCYWHSCPKHRSKPKTNVRYWRNKFRKNKQRDARNNLDLTKMRFVVYRVWECRIKNDTAGLVRLLVNVYLKGRTRAVTHRLLPW